MAILHIYYTRGQGAVEVRKRSAVLSAACLMWWSAY
jgi:hypothetical protein